MMEESLYNTRTSPWLPTRRAADIPGDSLLVLQGRGGSEFGLRAGDIARGVYLVGASRSGKTTVLCHCLAQLIPRLGPHDGLLVFDPRRDFQRRFCRQGDFVLDPDPQGSGNAVWSLFADLVAFGTSDYALEQNAARIAARMFSGKENQMNRFSPLRPGACWKICCLSMRGKFWRIPNKPIAMAITRCYSSAPDFRASGWKN